MGDSTSTGTPTTATQQGKGESTSVSSHTSTLKGNTPNKPSGKLNPDAKDYVPRGVNGSPSTPLPSGSSTSNSPAAGGEGSSSKNPRNRRRRNPDAAKTAVGTSGEVTRTVDSKGNTNRNRRNHGRSQKQASESAARIDDDDDIEINMDRPIELSENQQAESSSASTPSSTGAKTASSKDRRRDGREGQHKGKEVSGSSSSKPRNLKRENGRSRGAAAHGGPETSTSGRGSGSGSGSNNTTNRRQRNRKGDLGGRTFPISAGREEQAAESSGSQRHLQKNVSRAQPKKFVHTVEEDRDLMAALTAGLTNSTYECMVCWDVIRPAHKTWNCQVCWATFHLDCLSTWAKKSSEDPNNNGAGWRCPGCQNTQVSIPKEYSCFCGKVNNPDFNRYLTPHSCGELCGRSRDCPHSYFTFQTGKSCDQVCGELLGCGKHTCTSVCHAGLCPPCEKKQDQKCYCGKHERTVRCGDGEVKTTSIDGEMVTGYYECAEICNRPLACGHHQCTKKCHPLDDEPGQCSARPDVVSTCPCGSKTIETLLMGKTRSACTDPIPVCGGVCKKLLNCGHRCMQKCHLGDCSPCKMVVQVDCRCGSTQVKRVCSDMGLYGDELPTCERLCRGLRACGKHQCTNRCCPAKNQPKSKKGDLAALEAHVCTLILGKQCMCRKSKMPNVPCYKTNPSCGKVCDNPWDGKPRMIKCNDYCLIAERNKRVALALDIEDKGEPGPRIPEYDSYVLDYAAANMEFTLKIEKQLAEWVADTSKPILYFPPMKGHRRKFVHELAAHYNITSESVDVEPYRSVTIRRQQDTSVPALVASQACRQKRPTSASMSGSTVGLEQLRKPMIKDPVNAIYLHDLAFGLTRTELAAQLAPIFGNIKYGIRWLTDDDAILVPHPGSMQMDELEAVLVRLRSGIKIVAAKGNLCERVELCWVNKEGEVVSHTNIGGSQTRRFFNASQGSQLAKKAAAPKVTNTFALLDDDERIAAAKKIEEERILRAKEVAGTLSLDAWEEASASSSVVPVIHSAPAGSPTPGPVSVDGVSSETTEDLTKFVVVEAGEFTGEVVDDWQELLEDDDEIEDGNKEVGDRTLDEAETEVGAIGSESQRAEGQGLSSKGSSDDEGVIVNQSDLGEAEQNTRLGEENDQTIPGAASISESSST
ncbi:FKBP12-associated protein [Mortierella alpina]|nr:FKBP12-associated protein [Mortierella alpina]